MPLTERRYTNDQRDAVAYAYEDRKIRPARRVVDLAARGELEYEGRRLGPFQTNESTVRSEARNLRNKRAGKVRLEFAKAPPKDAIAALQRRLVAQAHQLLAEEERKPANKRDPQALSRIARLVRDIDAIPKANTEPEPKPRTRDQGLGAVKPAERAGALIQAMRTSEPAPCTDADTTNTSTENGDARAAEGEAVAQQEARERERPGSRVDSADVAMVGQL